MFTVACNGSILVLVVALDVHDVLLEAVGAHGVLILLHLGVHRRAIGRRGVLMAYESELHRLCQSLRLLVFDDEVTGFGVSLQAQRRVPNLVDIRRDPRHDEVV